MFEVAVVGSIALVLTLAIYSLGRSHGADVEREVVAKVLAEYRQLDSFASNHVSSILVKLPAEYRLAFMKIVDEIQQIAINARKAI